MKLKTIIVEDEPMARRSLENLCKQHSHIELSGICENGKTALEFLKDNPVDLILLDIEMPELTGIELLEQLAVLPQIIITTSNTEYAYDAFEYEVTDFLKKPITQSRFVKGIQKVIEQTEKLNEITLHSASQEFYIKHDSKLVRVPYDYVLYFENVGDYISVKTTQGNYIIYGTLKSLDNKLKYPGFLKVHRSYIVNLQKIKDIQDNNLVIEEKVIPISRAHKPILLKSINLIS